MNVEVRIAEAAEAGVVAAVLAEAAVYHSDRRVGPYLVARYEYDL
jgi:hypothetical protein